MKGQRDTAVVKSLLLLMLGLALLREVAAQNPEDGVADLLTPKNCPPPKGNKVRVDISLLTQNQGMTLSPNINNRSSSPWDYTINRDPHRFPSEIAEARCRYYGCVDAEGQENHFMNSVAIKQEMLVLKRELQGCVYAFRLEKIRVKVGCTCVTPIVRHVS